MAMNIASVVGSLAIPVTILAALLIFRRPIAELLGRVISYEGLGQKVSFGRKLAEAEESVNKAVARAEEVAVAQTPETTLAGAEEEAVTQAAAEAVGRTPLGVIDRERPTDAHALRKVTSMQQELRDIDLLRSGLAEVAHLASSNPSFVVIKAWEDLDNVLTLTQVWEKGYGDDKSFWRAVRELRDLRNKVAHGLHNPTAGEAVTYRDSARHLAETSLMFIGDPSHLPPGVPR